jgi:hypothetical protein
VSGAAFVVLVSVWLASVAACGGSDGGDVAEPQPPAEQIGGASEGQGTSSETTGSTTTTLDPVVAREAAILEAVDGYWRTFEEAAVDPVNPDHPGFEQYYTGAALTAMRSSLAMDVDRGLATRFPNAGIRSEWRQVIESSEVSAVVRVCLLDDGVVYEVGSGDVVDGSFLALVMELWLVRLEGDWKVSEVVESSRQEGTLGCPAA